MSFEDLDILWASIKRGLRRFWWLVLVLPLLIGAVAYLLMRPTGPLYEARATVVATRTTLPIDQLVGTASELFNAGVVAETVVDETGVSRPGVESRIGFRPVSGSPVFYIVGRGPDPESAVELSNSAAKAFVSESDKLDELGSFTIFVDASSETVSSQSTLPATLAAVAAGLFSLIGLVVLMVALEGPFRPVASTRRLARSLNTDVGLVWVENSTVTVDPVFSSSLSDLRATEWIVRPVGDCSPVLIERLVDRLPVRAEQSGGRSIWRVLTVVPDELRLGAALSDPRMVEALSHERGSHPVALLKMPAGPDGE